MARYSLTYDVANSDAAVYREIEQRLERNFEDVKTLLLLLSDSVATRIREGHYGKAHTIKVTVTDNQLKTLVL